MKSKTINNRRRKQKNTIKLGLSSTERMVTIKSKNGTFKQVSFASLLKTKQQPKTEFHITAIGLAKRESGKYERRKS